MTTQRRIYVNESVPLFKTDHESAKSFVLSEKSFHCTAMMRQTEKMSSKNLYLIRPIFLLENATRSSVYPTKSMQCFAASIASVRCQYSSWKLISIKSVTIKKLKAMIWKIARIQKYLERWMSIQIMRPLLKDALLSIDVSLSPSSYRYKSFPSGARKSKLIRDEPKTNPVSPPSSSLSD